MPMDEKPELTPEEKETLAQARKILARFHSEKKSAAARANGLKGGRPSAGCNCGATGDTHKYTCPVARSRRYYEKKAARQTGG